MRVVIVGGGIGGMTLALSLRAAGIEDVHVYESTPTVNELGVGINVLLRRTRADRARSSRTCSWRATVSTPWSAGRSTRTRDRAGGTASPCGVRSRSVSRSSPAAR